MVSSVAARIVIAAPLHNRNRSPEGLKNPLTPGFLPGLSRKFRQW
jgi:hypothetical protein